MTTHTPGPWKAEPHSAHEISFLITSTAPQSVGGDRTVTVAKFASSADALLIAAAPDMLAALQKAEEFLRERANYDPKALDLRDAARAAIAKAEALTLRPTHTLGPWRVEPYSLHKISFAIVAGEKTEIAHKASKANARLIAAAPDLLAAVKALMLYEEDGAFLSGDSDKARAAIAKAEGTS